jgi:biotin synthase
MSDETQALCFLAGANSIFYGDKLLTTENPEEDQDRKLFAKLGITAEPPAERGPTACGRPAEVPEPATAVAN